MQDHEYKDAYQRLELEVQTLRQNDKDRQVLVTEQANEIARLTGLIEHQRGKKGVDAGLVPRDVAEADAAQTSTGSRAALPAGQPGDNDTQDRDSQPEKASRGTEKAKAPAAKASSERKTDDKPKSDDKAKAKA